MVTKKTLLCRCEDVTLDECREAIHAGYEHFEDLKRYLGVGTGPCQGKACVQACMQVVAAERRIPIQDVDVMTFRPPVKPVSFATLAAEDAPSTERTEPTERASVSSVRSVDRPGAKP